MPERKWGKKSTRVGDRDEANTEQQQDGFSLIALPTPGSHGELYTLIKTGNSLGQDRSSDNCMGNNVLESYAAWNCIFNSVSQGATSCLIHWFLHQVDLTRHVLPSEETQPRQIQAVGSREEVGAPSSCGAGVSLGPIPSHWTLPPSGRGSATQMCPS